MRLEWMGDIWDDKFADETEGECEERDEDALSEDDDDSSESDSDDEDEDQNDNNGMPGLSDWSLGTISSSDGEKDSGKGESEVGRNRIREDGDS